MTGVGVVQEMVIVGQETVSGGEQSAFGVSMEEIVTARRKQTVNRVNTASVPVSFKS